MSMDNHFWSGNGKTDTDSYGGKDGKVRTNGPGNPYPPEISDDEENARQVAEYIKEHNGAPPKGYKGGRVYENVPKTSTAQKLPEGINYREYDVYPYVKGDRGLDRIVIGDDGSVWYTEDHYETFKRIE